MSKVFDAVLVELADKSVRRVDLFTPVGVSNFNIGTREWQFGLVMIMTLGEALEIKGKKFVVKGKVLERFFDEYYKKRGV